MVFYQHHLWLTSVILVISSLEFVVTVGWSDSLHYHVFLHVLCQLLMNMNLLFSEFNHTCICSLRNFVVISYFNTTSFPDSAAVERNYAYGSICLDSQAFYSSSWVRTTKITRYKSTHMTNIYPSVCLWMLFWITIFWSLMNIFLLWRFHLS
jgi:hypothetical protein